MFNTLLNDNVLRIIRINFVIRIISNTRIIQLERKYYQCVYLIVYLESTHIHSLS